MTKKRKRGRPLGGKHPESIRAYWRELQKEHRAKQAIRGVSQVFDLNTRVRKTQKKSKRRGR